VAEYRWQERLQRFFFWSRQRKKDSQINHLYSSSLNVIGKIEYENKNAKIPSKI
jgi:hypothetical protein